MTRNTPPDVSTSALIDRLSHDLRPVTPLRHPVTRAVIWVLMALAFAMAMVWAIGVRPDLAEQLRDPWFVVEQVAALATGFCAAVAALALTIPASPIGLRLLPLFPATLWAATLGVGCLRDWLRAGSGGLYLTPDMACFVYIALIGSLPALVMGLMLRRGAQLRLSWSLAAGGLAAAAIGNFGLRFFHMQDAALMVLVWQFGSVILIAALAGSIGARILRKPFRDAAP